MFNVETGFGTIRNSTALKPENQVFNGSQLFWDHSKQHSSKTYIIELSNFSEFWDHSKQHSSKTSVGEVGKWGGFWDHSKQHSSKTDGTKLVEVMKVLGPFETAQL